MGLLESITLRELVIFILMFLGSFFMLLAGIGILRMPDTFLRMSATSKAGTLGAGLIVVGAALHFNEFSIYTRSMAIVAFLVLTVPVAAHMIGRAAYFDGVPLWSCTLCDDLRSHYQRSTHDLVGEPVPLEDQVEFHPDSDEFQEEEITTAENA